MAWWCLWCLTSVLGGALVSGVSWSTACLRYGYAPTFDFGFPALVGGMVGGLLSFVTGACLRGFSRVWWAQAAGFGAAGVLAAAAAHFLHILATAPVAIAAYVLLLGVVARRDGRGLREYQCAFCECDLRGSESGSCPGCGAPTSKAGLGVPQGARCRECGYLLVLLPESRCPECFTEFDADDPETFIVPDGGRVGLEPWLLLCFCLLVSAFSIAARDVSNLAWLVGSVFQGAVAVLAAIRLRRSCPNATVLYWLSLVVAVGAAMFAVMFPRLY